MISLILAAALAIPPGGGSPPMSASEAAVKDSTWSTVYGDTAGKFAVPARLTFRGDTGTYNPEGKPGQICPAGLLTGITYGKAGDSGITQINGNWAYAGKFGWFTFDVLPASGPHRETLRGAWGYGQLAPTSHPDGYWISVVKN